MLRFRVSGTLILQGFEMAKMALAILYTYIVQIRFLSRNGRDCVTWGLFSKDVGRK
jgi:hypothetical protein